MFNCGDNLIKSILLLFWMFYSRGLGLILRLIMELVMLISNWIRIKISFQAWFCLAGDPSWQIHEDGFRIPKRCYLQKCTALVQPISYSAGWNFSSGSDPCISDQGWDRVPGQRNCQPCRAFCNSGLSLSTSVSWQY